MHDYQWKYFLEWFIFLPRMRSWNQWDFQYLKLEALIISKVMSPWPPNSSHWYSSECIIWTVSMPGQFDRQPRKSKNQCDFSTLKNQTLASLIGQTRNIQDMKPTSLDTVWHGEGCVSWPPASSQIKSLTPFSWTVRGTGFSISTHPHLRKTI